MRFLPFLVLLAAATASADEEYRELVVDGNEVSQRQRYRFWVQSTGQVFCGASLVWNDVVMSSASCGRQAFNRGEIVYVGNIQRDSAAGGAQRRQILSNPVVHPDYSASLLINDYMLFQIKPVTRSGSVISLNYDKKEPKENDRLTFIGMGYTRPNGKLSDELRKIKMLTSSSNVCEKFAPARPLPDSILCAEGVGDQDTCTGDAGGPLFTANQVQVGILSGSSNNCKGNPSFFANVADQVDWIEETICKITAMRPLQCCFKMMKRRCNCGLVLNGDKCNRKTAKKICTTLNDRQQKRVIQRYQRRCRKNQL